MPDGQNNSGYNVDAGIDHAMPGQEVESPKVILAKADEIKIQAILEQNASLIRNLSRIIDGHEDEKRFVKEHEKDTLKDVLVEAEAKINNEQIEQTLASKATEQFKAVKEEEIENSPQLNILSEKYGILQGVQEVLDKHTIEFGDHSPGDILPSPNTPAPSNEQSMGASQETSQWPHGNSVATKVDPGEKLPSPDYTPGGQGPKGPGQGMSGP